MIVLLDAGPLGMITNPKSSPENQECKDWLANLVSKGIEIVIPEIVDYELRRELLGGKGPWPWPPGRIERHLRLFADYDVDHGEGCGILGNRPEDRAKICGRLFVGCRHDSSCAGNSIESRKQ